MIRPPVGRSARELVLGVDFGSSTTIAGVLIGDNIELVEDQGDPVVPSMLYIPDRGAIEVGRRVLQRQLTDPSRIVRSIKRVFGACGDAEMVRRYIASSPFLIDRAGDRLTFKLGGGVFAPEQLVGRVLERMRELAEVRFGATIRKAVVTISVDAPGQYRAAMQRAGKIAHLEIVEMIAEPIAGALALDLHTVAADRNIVVCDLGGGTFDVAAVRQHGLAFTPIAVAGDHYLGGDDFDEALAEALAGTVFRHHGYDLHKDLVRWNELLLRCESAKRQLSTQVEAPLTMRDAYVAQSKPRDLSIILERAWVDAAWAPLLTRARQAIVELLLRARWRPEQVDVVGLIGGCSRIPAFRAVVAELFGAEKLLSTPAPELAVAKGATLFSARHRAVMSDQLPRIDPPGTD